MQVHQRMDLDQINENDHHPIKPSLNNNQNENNQPLKPTLNANKKQRNRTFGQDLTNQQRQQNNQNIPPQKNSNRASNDGSFNFSKPKIVVVPGEKAETKVLKRKLSMDMDKIYDEENQKKTSYPSSDSFDSEMEEVIDCTELAPWDHTDCNDDLFVTDYVEDIMNGLREDEALNRGGCIIENDTDFMTQQKDVNARMRVVLVDWLIEVHRKFKLLPSTYFLGINLLDRYLSKKQLHRRKLQLCGCTCLWIASKYHEIYAPEMDDFVYISDNAFSDQDLMSMEIEILKTLSFTLTVPTVLNYGQRYSKISSYYLKKEREIKIISDLIMYCIEHSVMSYALCRKKPSLIGAASFVYSCISTKVFSIQTFEKDNIGKVIGYTFDELIPIMKQIDQIVRNAKKAKNKAVYKKYCNQKYSNIGKLNFDKLNTNFLNKEI